MPCSEALVSKVNVGGRILVQAQTGSREGNTLNVVADQADLVFPRLGALKTLETIARIAA